MKKYSTEINELKQSLEKMTEERAYLDGRIQFTQVVIDFLETIPTEENTENA